MAANNPQQPADYLALDDDALVRQCEVDNYRSSGPGGQKRNKTSSAVRLRHLPTGLSVTATEDRSQHVNKRKAIWRLREAIALHVRRIVDPVAYAPSAVVKELLRPNGVLAGPRDPRYYQVIQEVVDVLCAHLLRISDAAATLGMSTAQLVKLIQNDNALWERVNQLRQSAGEKPLR